MPSFSKDRSAGFGTRRKFKMNFPTMIIAKQWLYVKIRSVNFYLLVL
ncbi:hypothetical protein LEP1GSC187_1427 [Leptospira santarosai str. ZUN179]|uniref:Uncharacterized protein n=1 Tax=Leptospira santarosai str. ZUN179 TaxID=1049985 RepID=M6UQM0_9LEPT|nr:hypothetical protein LEP1GSC187_1427 [Leptospira santarosai str. ZUN179]